MLLAAPFVCMFEGSSVRVGWLLDLALSDFVLTYDGLRSLRSGGSLLLKIEPRPFLARFSLPRGSYNNLIHVTHLLQTLCS